jgi:hypothetical protein
MASHMQGQHVCRSIMDPALTMLQRSELLALEDVTAYLGSMAISEGGLSEAPEDDSNDEFS